MKVLNKFQQRCTKSENYLPNGKRNHKGKLASGAQVIKSLLAKEYKERLRSRPDMTPNGREALIGQ